jgi:hypothetical protein
MLAVVLFEQIAAMDTTKPSGTQETLSALDIDGSGKVERNEIEAYASSQGLNGAQVRAEFQQLDSNGDGELGESEISNLLSQPEDAARSTSTATVGVGSVAQAPMPAAVAAPNLEGLQSVSQQPVSVAAVDAGLVQGSSAQLEAVELQVQLGSSRILAETFAHSASNVLASRGRDVQKAAKLEEAVKSLRGQVAEIQRTAVQAAANAAKKATESVLHETINTVRGLEAAAAQATHDAAASKSRANAALQLALKAQADMQASVKQLSDEAA